MEKNTTTLALTTVVLLAFLAGCKHEVGSTLNDIWKEPAPDSKATRVIGEDINKRPDTVDIFPGPAYNHILEQVPAGGRVALQKRIQRPGSVDQGDIDVLATKALNGL